MAERPSDPSPEQLEELGISADDLGAFDVSAPADGTEDDVRDQESTLAEPTALITEADATPAERPDQPPAPRTEPAERKTEAPTPHAETERKHALARTEERQPAPGTQPTAPAPSAPDPAASTALVPWTPTADGRRLAIEGAVVEATGDVRIPKASLPVLQRHLADRGAWIEERSRLKAEIEARDPDNHEAVILSRILATEMEKAAAKGDEALWDWVQGFRAEIPRLRAEAKAEAITRENQRLRARTEGIDRQAEREQLEPMLETALTEELDKYLALPELAGLKPQRDKLLKRFWENRGEIFNRADKDYPEHQLVKGQPFLQRRVLEEQLVFAADLLKEQTDAARAEEQRTEAARRNAAALGDGKGPPPAAPVGGMRPTAPASTDGRPMSREAWLDRMEQIAST